MPPERLRRRTRRYDNTRRKRQMDLTRRRILESVVDLVNERGLDGFSVQEVADAAGVAHRTVYRHFPNRQALVDGIHDYAAEVLEESGAVMLPTDARVLPRDVETGFQHFDAIEPIMRAAITVSANSTMVSAESAKRTESFRRVLRRFAPNLDDAVIDDATAAVRALATHHTWWVMRRDYGFDGARAGRVVGHYLNLILDDLAARDARARDETNGGGSDA